MACLYQAFKDCRSSLLPMYTHGCPPSGAPTLGTTAAYLRKCSINVKSQIPLSIPHLIYQVLAYLSSLPVLIHSIGISLSPIIALESQHPHSSYPPVHSWKVRWTLLLPQTIFQNTTFARSLKRGSIFQVKLRDVVPARTCKACPLRLWRLWGVP